jgi:hypothetical protein
VKTSRRLRPRRKERLATDRAVGSTSCVMFWGLVSRELDEAIELYATRAAAERALAEMLGDQPEWEDVLFVAEVELGGAEARPSLN